MYTRQKFFWATYGTTTSAEIEAAYQAGKIVMATNASRVFILGVRSAVNSHTFFSATYSTVYQIKCDSDAWTNNSRPIPAGASITPSPLGTAAVGDGTTYARSNHVHPMPSANDVGAMSKWQWLWTNPTPRADFPATTINIADVGSYDAVFIMFVQFTSQYDPYGYALGLTGVYNAIYTHSAFRRYTVNANSIDFEAATSAIDWQQTNSEIIPYKIFGIKGVIDE